MCAENVQIIIAANTGTICVCIIFVQAGQYCPGLIRLPHKNINLFYIKFS